MSQKDSSDEVVKEWFGQLPKGWELRRLRTLGRFSSSGIDKKTVEGEPLVRMVNYTDVYGNSTLELRNSPDYMVVSCPANKVDEHGLRQGDMLFTPSSETAEDIGVSAVVMEDLDNTVYSYHITRFRMRDGISVRYRKYLCNHPRVLRQFSRLCKGTTRQILVREDFKSAWVAVPPPDQHDRIAAHLDEATAKVDRLIKLRERQMELLQEQRAALIQQAVTRGLNPRAPLKDSGLPWLGQIPKHWVVKPIKYIFVSLDGRRVPLSGADRQLMTKRDYDYYGASGVIDRVDDYIFDETLILLGEDGANLLNRSTPLAFLATGKYWVNNHAHILKPRRGLMEYLVHLLETVDFAPFVEGSAQPKLTLEKLMSVKIPEPPESEQRLILDFIEDQNAKTDRLLSAYTRQLELLTEYRAALIHECVTGQRAVPTN